MSVIPLTLIISLCLAFTLVIFILRKNLKRVASTAREPVRQVTDATPRLAEPQHHDHDDDPYGCGCQSGRRVPCSGCLKRTSVASIR